MARISAGSMPWIDHRWTGQVTGDWGQRPLSPRRCQKESSKAVRLKSGDPWVRYFLFDVLDKYNIYYIYLTCMYMIYIYTFIYIYIYIYIELYVSMMYHFPGTFAGVFVPARRGVGCGVFRIQVGPTLATWFCASGHWLSFPQAICEWQHGRGERVVHYCCRRV